MKSKINVVIHKSGTENENLLRIVANHNEGTAKVELDDIIGYLNARRAMYPTVSNYFILQPEDHILVISEDGGKTDTLTMEWREVHELATSN